MSFKVLTLDELHELGLAHLRGRIPGASIAKGDDYWLRTRAVAAVAYVIQQQNLDAVRNILPSTADPSFLPEHARVRLGDANATLPAAKARGKVQVRGASAAVSIIAGTKLTHANGRKYSVSVGGLTYAHSFTTKSVAVGSTLDRLILDADATGMSTDRLISVGADAVVRAIRDILPEVGTPYAVDFYLGLISMPAAGDTVDGVIGTVLAVEADEAGAEGNLLPGDTLTFDSPPGDVTAATTVLEMTGGGDVETTEETRRRILAFMQERPGSGNRADYREWVRETTNVRVEDACVYVGYRGIGTIDVVPIGVSGARQTGTVTNGLIEAYLATVTSELDDFRVRQLLDGSTADVTMELSTSSEFVADWLSVYNLTVDTGSTTTVVHVTSTPIGVIALGDRILVYVANGVRPGLYQRVVSGLTASTITVSEPLPAAPTSGAKVDPGGPNTQTVIDAIYAFFDGLGPGDPSSARRFPEGASAWEWVLRPESISHAVLALDGIDGCKVTAPAAAVTPAQFARVRPGVVRVTFGADSQPSIHV